LARERTPAWIVLQCEAITDIDVTAAEVLKALDEELNDRGVHLAFVELRDRLQDLVRHYGLHTTLDQEHFYPSLDQALDAINNAAGDGPRPPDEGMTPL
jgi:MFS superfamily sulfate permease-like transporter